MIDSLGTSIEELLLWDKKVTSNVHWFWDEFDRIRFFPCEPRIRPCWCNHNDENLFNLGPRVRYNSPESQADRGWTKGSVCPKKNSVLLL